MNFKIASFLTLVLVIQVSNAFILNPFGSIFKWNHLDGQNSLLDEPFEFDLDGTNQTIDKRNYMYGCKCESQNCSCCAHVEVKKIKLNNTGKFYPKFVQQNLTFIIGCVNMSYSNLDDIYLIFDLDGKILYEKSISGTLI